MKITNFTNIGCFDEFISLYEDKILHICPLMSNVEIDVRLVDDYLELYGKDELRLEQVSETPLSYYTEEKKELQAQQSHIVINPHFCEKLSFTNTDYLASFAHEIGHLIYNFNENKSDDTLFQEIISDRYASRIGFDKELLGVLEKMVNSNLFSIDICKQIETRIFWIKIFICSMVNKNQLPI